MKKFLKIIPIFIVIIILIIIIVIKSGAGNGNGNMSNMGLVLEHDGITYYNKYETGIFKVENNIETKLTDETAYSLTMYDDKIYYMTVGDFNNVSIKNVDLKNGNINDVITIYTSISKFYIENGYIYYFTDSGENKICRVNINGKNEETLVLGNIQDFELGNNNIYYINGENKICSFEIKNGENKILNEDFYVKKIQLVDGWIYFYNEDENALFRISENGKNYGLVSILVNNETYNVCGEYVYYLDSVNSKICRMQLENSNKCDDVVKISISKTKINISGDMLYYLDKSNNETQNYQMHRIHLSGDKTKDIEY